jgi:hypothetical protein
MLHECQIINITNCRFLTLSVPMYEGLKCLHEAVYPVKKVIVFPVPGRDVTNLFYSVMTVWILLISSSNTLLPHFFELLFALSPFRTKEIMREKRTFFVVFKIVKSVLMITFFGDFL